MIIKDRGIESQIYYSSDVDPTAMVIGNIAFGAKTTVMFGAAQHITGCINSKKIVTINRDPDANMFKISDLGLVADYKTVVPLLIEKLKAMNP